MAQARTLYDKIWDDHVIDEQPDGTCLLYVDRHLIHEVTSPQAFEGLRLSGRKVRNPEKTLAVVDHNVPTTDRSLGIDDPESATQIEVLATNAREFGIEYYSERDQRQGICHIIGPEQGFTLPGMTIVCGDSHTSTHGAFGSLAHGIGTSEVEHVLATQTLIQKKAKNMRVTVDGQLPPGVTAKDIVLAIIGEIGTAGGTGHVIEYDGEAIRSLSMEGRMTVCNMSIEGGARAGMVAPDKTTFAYVAGKPKAPSGAAWDAALRFWDTLRTDEGAFFDREIRLDAADLPPLVTWGTSPEDVISVTGLIPDPNLIEDENRRRSKQRALEYMGLKPGTRITDIPVSRVFIGSLHQWPHRGFAQRGGPGPGPAGAPGRERDDRAGIRAGEDAGGKRGPRPDLRRRGFRVARARLLHVPCHERRSAEPRRALRLDLEPQFRRPPGLQGALASGLSGHGGGGRHRRPLRRCQDLRRGLRRQVSGNSRCGRTTANERRARRSSASSGTRRRSAPQLLRVRPAGSATISPAATQGKMIRSRCGGGASAASSRSSACWRWPSGSGGSSRGGDPGRVGRSAGSLAGGSRAAGRGRLMPACRPAFAACARAWSSGSRTFPTRRPSAQLGAQTPFDLLGLFRGIGLAQGGAVPATGRFPNMVWLYRRPILDYWAEHEETLGAIVVHVLVHEIGHHFGLSDEDMAALEAAAES